MDNNEVVVTGQKSFIQSAFPAAVVENNTGIEIEPLFAGSIRLRFLIHSQSQIPCCKKGKKMLIASFF